MLCQHCGKNEATTHVKSIVNGEYTEYMLCPECAKEMGYTSLWSDMQSDFSSLIGSFFSNALPERTGAVRCSKCSSSYNDIANSGKVGCAHCYETFYNQLLPTVRKVHGNTEHCGKSPKKLKKDNVESSSNNEKELDINAQSQKEIENLREQLSKAIEVQDFEKAAELRDKIKEMEGEK